ncbi:hypothetical protein [Klebsiella sp. GG_Kp170]|uniref:hypothetical protein n=1 Tax=Klebsiella sp. GG_Kp170 TaxID=3153481 RepID=UPI0032B5911C|nr:hypothetical protein [Klebsiella variicola subsp. variicola]
MSLNFVHYPVGVGYTIFQRPSGLPIQVEQAYLVEGEDKEVQDYLYFLNQVLGETTPVSYEVIMSGTTNVPSRVKLVWDTDEFIKMSRDEFIDRFIKPYKGHQWIYS